MEDYFEKTYENFPTIINYGKLLLTYLGMDYAI